MNALTIQGVPNKSISFLHLKAITFGFMYISSIYLSIYLYKREVSASDCLSVGLSVTFLLRGPTNHQR